MSDFNDGIEKAAELALRWANDCSDFLDEPKIQIQHNVCRSIAVAIDNLKRPTPDRSEARERIAETIRQWTSHSYMQLHAGEMTAQERRTVTAVVEAIERQVCAILATGLVQDEDQAVEVQDDYDKGFQAGAASWTAIIEEHKIYTTALEASFSQVQQEAADSLAVLDAIADYVGCPHDEELTVDHVRQHYMKLENAAQRQGIEDAGRIANAQAYSLVSEASIRADEREK